MDGRGQYNRVVAEILKLYPGGKIVREADGFRWSTPPSGRSGRITEVRFKREPAIRLYRDDSKHRDFWLINKAIYVTNDQKLTKADALALANEAVNRRRLRLEKAHALQALSQDLATTAKRTAIPQDVKVLVWQRDRGRCVTCGSQENLEFDHVIPFSMGGSNTARNLQVLCETCNRRKGGTLG